MFTVEKVTSRADFAALEGQWNELLAHSASDAITLTHQWLLTWWDVFGEGRELNLILVREGEILIGIAPFLRRTVRHFGLNFRRVEFLASGEDECDEICSDYLDFLLRIGNEEVALGAILDGLMEQKNWDELVLTDISGESPHLPLLHKLATARELEIQTTREQMCIFVTLPATHDQLLAGVSGQNRKRLSKDRRTATKISARVQKVVTLEEWEAAFEILVDLHQNRWTARGEPGSFSSEKFMKFHRELAPKMLERGWLQLWILWQDGEALSALYDFVYAGKIFYYQSGMTTQSGAIRSPSLLLRGFALEEAIGAGLTECDFLKGEIGSYKFGWGGATRPIVQLRLARGGAKEAVFKGADHFVNELRPLKRRLLRALKRGRLVKTPSPIS